MVRLEIGGGKSSGRLRYGCKDESRGIRNIPSTDIPALFRVPNPSQGKTKVKAPLLLVAKNT